MRRRGCADEGLLFGFAVIVLLVVVTVVVGVSLLSYNIFDRALTKAEKAQAEKPPEPKP